MKLTKQTPVGQDVATIEVTTYEGEEAVVIAVTEHGEGEYENAVIICRVEEAYAIAAAIKDTAEHATKKV